MITTWTVLRSETHIGFWVPAKVIIDRYDKSITVIAIAEPEFLEAAIDRVREELDGMAQLLKAQPIVRPVPNVH